MQIDLADATRTFAKNKKTFAPVTSKQNLLANRQKRPRISVIDCLNFFDSTERFRTPLARSEGADLTAFDSLFIGDLISCFL